MSKIKRFLEAMEDSEFRKPYTKLEQETVHKRIKDKYCSKLLKTILEAAKHRGLRLNILDDISVSGEEVRTGEIIIQIFKNENK